MSQATRSLFALRRAIWRNTLKHWQPKNQVLLWVGIVALLMVILWIGHINVATFIAPPGSTTIPTSLQPRSNSVAGARALEIAFWLTAFASAVSSFRVMELLFRRKDVRQLQHLPLDLKAYFVDRVSYGLLEVLGLSTLLSLLFVPMLWHGQFWIALSCALMCFGGLLATFCVGFGVQLYAGDREFGHIADKDQQAAVAAGELFMFAPGIALLFSMILNLFLKLGLGEVIRLSALTRPAMLALGVTILASLIGLGLGFVYFRKCYFRILAGFREADFVGFKVQLDYQKSAFDIFPKSAKIVQPSARGLYQRHRLQYGRRYLLTRYMYGFACFLFGIACWQLAPKALPSWVAMGIIFAVLAVLVHPWSRINRAGIVTPHLHALPIDSNDEQSAMAWFTLREAMGFALPMIVVFAGIRAIQLWQGQQNDVMILHWVGISILGIFCIHGVQLLSQKLSTHAFFGIISAILTVVILVAAQMLSTIAGISISVVGALLTVLYHLQKLSSFSSSR